jgi:hypothetical protein
MEIAEALQFLELDAHAQRAEIIHAIDNKRVFFETLYQNAPSPVLKQIHGKNLEKVEAARKILLGNQEAPKLSSLELSKPEQSQNPIPAPACPAFLIIHTEGLTSYTFNLKEGNNLIGRIHDPSVAICLERDQYVSRIHASIRITQGSVFLSDGNPLSGGKPSMNGTYLNGGPDRLQPGREHALQDNDQFQVGMTKLIFKWNNKALAAIQEEVAMTGHVSTIFINI